jgi:hypothetical protein
VKAFSFAVMLLVAAGCRQSGDNTDEVAGVCGVSEADLERVVAEVKGAKPGTSKKIGKCDVRIEPNGLLSVGPISPPKKGN